MSRHHIADDPRYGRILDAAPEAPTMASHRDYSAEELRRAIDSARMRKKAFRAGTPEFYAAAAVLTTLIEERCRRRDPARTVASVLPGGRRV